MRISALRKALEQAGQRESRGELLMTRAPGYRLYVGEDELDANRFERLLASGRMAMRAADPDTAAVTLGEALSLWRGEPLADFAYEPFAQAEIVRLNDLRASALEERIEADLELGRSSEVISELEGLVAAFPLRERPRGLLMLALYRSGRQADALAVYHATRRILVDELGLEPGTALQQLERQILVQDPTLDARPTADARPMTATRPRLDLATMPATRKVVTVTAIDLFEGPGRIDPERMLPVGERCLRAVSAAIEAHGGTVEASLGTNVLAVFGSPVLHEDDALRAIRASIAVREAISNLNEELQRDFGVQIAARIGVATGEVLTGGLSPGRPSVTGEPMILARRLQQSAGAGEILLADATRQESDWEILVEAADGTDLTDAGIVWRLIQAHERERLDLGADSAFVGRVNELAQLQSAFERAVRDRTLHLCTIVGPEGFGKSRVAQEFQSHIAEKATVVIGRCLAYGEGITFWPLREVIRQLAPDGEISGLLHGDADAELVAGRVAGAVGIAEASASVDESFWAVRRLLEAVARERPLVVILEDIHWAESTLLALLEYVAAGTRDVPVMLLCLARPELLENRPSFGAGAGNMTTILLEPLIESESQALIDDRLGARRVDPDVSARINAAAQGNPLFLEQIVAMVAQPGAPSGEVPIPPTIRAVIAARIERLGPGERAILEQAAVIGMTFSRRAVDELLLELGQASIGRHLETLVAKDLLRSEAAGWDGGEIYRFRHVLIQQSCYGSIPKQRRAQAHAGFASWLETNASEGILQLEEVLGYHLEQTYRYRAELSPSTEDDLDLARRAGELLASAGSRAFKAGDMPASINLLRRATALLPPDDSVRLELLSDLGFALFEFGELQRSSEVLSEVIARGTTIGDDQVVARATVKRQHIEMYRHPEQVDQARLLADAARATSVLQAFRDEAGLGRAALLVSETQWTLGRGGLAAKAAVRAARHARRAGSRREEAWSHGDYGYYAVFGPTPVKEATRRMERWLGQAGGDAVLEANLEGFLAPLAAMEGRISEARDRLAQSLEQTEKLGLRWQTGTHALLGAFIEMLAEEPGVAEGHLDKAIEMFTAMGDMWFVSILSIELARALYEQGRNEDALTAIERLDALPADPSYSYRIRRNTILSRIESRRGDLVAAFQFAQAAVEAAQRTDYLGFHADALVARANILQNSGKPTEALDSLGSAIELYERKGNLVEGRKARVLRTNVGDVLRS